MKCLECNMNFKVMDRIKSLNNKNCEIRCLNCNSIFIKEENSGRFITSLIIGGVAFLSISLGVPLIKKCFENFLVGILIIGFISAFTVFLFLLISQNWWKYKKK